MFVFPYSREKFYNKTPWIVLGLTIINTAILIATYSDPKPVFLKYGFVAADPHLLTAVTSMFLHAGFWHLAGNMFFLWMFGGQVENRLGPWLFSLLYLVCGLGGGGLHYLTNHESTIPTVGASGAISGIVGAYFLFFPRARFDLDFYLGWWRVKTVRTRTYAAVGAWFGEQLLLGLSTMTHGASIAFWAHVGGFLAGLGGAAVFRAVLPMQPEPALPAISAGEWEKAPEDDGEDRLQDHVTTLKL